MNYLYFTLFSGLSGAALATFIRMELASPGSHYFKGDSIKYIQVITAHGLIMIFYVVIPIIFGMFANFFIPYHIGSKDVAFPRLNSIGFWLLPAGFILLAKPAFLRRQTYRSWDPYDAYFSTKYDVVSEFYKINNKYVETGLFGSKYSPQNRFLGRYATPRYYASIQMQERTILKGDFQGRFALYETLLTNINDSLSLGKIKITDSHCVFENKLKQYFSLLTAHAVDPLSKDYWSKVGSVGKIAQAEARVILDKNNNSRTNVPNIVNWSEVHGSANYLGRNRARTGGVLNNLVGWTDFIMLWEHNYNWVSLPWEHLTQASNTRNVLLKNHKCDSPTYVMSGWTFITPFSSQVRFTGLGSQDVAIVSVLIVGASTTISFTNLLITRRVLGVSGLRNRKNLIPFLSISLFLVMRMLSLITPVLASAMIMLLLDRHWGTSFFDYAYGGDVILFHHLFWFFGHPEVYVVIIPAFGIVNMLLPNYNMRRLASKNHLIWATYVMGYMGFLVWGHHMYLVGLDHRSRSLYSTITVMISLPAVVKIVNWTLSLLNGMLVFTISLAFAISFFMFFLSGGLTGLWLSHVGLNIFVHDTFYVVAHFHFMFSCATFSAIFAGIYFYFDTLFGVKYNKILATLHFIFWTAGQWLTFLPLYWVGYNGLPRRYHDYPLMYLGWQGLATLGHTLTLLGLLFFILNIAESKLGLVNSIISIFTFPRMFKDITYLVSKSAYAGAKSKNTYFANLHYRKFKKSYSTYQVV